MPEDGMKVVSRRVLVNGQPLYFCYKDNLSRGGGTKSKLEINFEQLYEIVSSKKFPNASFICESGWSFNDPEKIRKSFGSYDLLYFILNPSLVELRKRYVRRHLGTKKKIERSDDWKNYEERLWKPQIRSLLRIKQKLSPTEYFELADISLEEEARIVERNLRSHNGNTLFFIVGPNSAGKTTLFMEIIKVFGLMIVN